MYQNIYHGIIYNNKYQETWDFPGGALVKNPPANAGDTCLSPGLGRSHMRHNYPACALEPASHNY